MAEQYKRIITIRDEQVVDLQSHMRSGLSCRHARSGASEWWDGSGEWVIVGPMHERKQIDKIVQVFDAA